MIDFAYKLKALRDLRGWSQDELAKRLGVTRSAIGNWEQGTREPDFEALESIADVFNCTICYLVGGEPMELSAVEIEIIEAYRRMSPELKAAVHGMMGIKGAPAECGAAVRC